MHSDTVAVDHGLHSRQSVIEMEEAKKVKHIGKNKVLRWRSLEPNDMEESQTRHAVFMEEYKKKGFKGIDGLKPASKEEPSSLPSRNHRSMTSFPTVYEDGVRTSGSDDLQSSDDDLEILEVEIEREINDCNEQALLAGRPTMMPTRTGQAHRVHVMRKAGITRLQGAEATATVNMAIKEMQENISELSLLASGLQRDSPQMAARVRGAAYGCLENVAILKEYSRQAPQSKGQLADARAMVKTRKGLGARHVNVDALSSSSLKMKSLPWYRRVCVDTDLRSTALLGLAIAFALAILFTGKDRQPHVGDHTFDYLSEASFEPTATGVDASGGGTDLIEMHIKVPATLNATFTSGVVMWLQRWELEEEDAAGSGGGEGGSAGESVGVPGGGGHWVQDGDSTTCYMITDGPEKCVGSFKPSNPDGGPFQVVYQYIADTRSNSTASAAGHDDGEGHDAYHNGEGEEEGDAEQRIVNRYRRSADSHGSSSSDTPPEQVFIEVQLHQFGKIGLAKVWLALLIMLMVLVLIAMDLLHRTLTTFLGALLTFGLLMWCRMIPNMQVVVTWIDESTVILLFGMMIMIGKLAETGLFTVATAKVVRASRGDLGRLTTILCILTGALSAFLDNVTTMLLIAPITIELAHVLQIEAVPLLTALTVFSNIGGAATMIGDPPNLIVGSALSEIGFADFLASMLPAVVIMFMPCMIFLKWEYKGKLSGKLTHFKRALEVVKDYKIRDPMLLMQTGGVLFTVILCLLLHDYHHVDHSWLALLGAISLMIASEPHNVEHALHAVEWETLLYFASLFVMVEGMASLGLIRTIGNGLTDLIASVAPEQQEMVGVVVMLWVSALVSSCLDNTAYTATMVTVVRQLASSSSGLEGEIRLKPLAWALCFGACLGGNGTLIGSSANIIVQGIAEKHKLLEGKEKVTFGGFFKVAFPVMLLSVTFAMAWLLIRFET